LEALMINTLADIVSGRFLNPEVAAEVAKTSRNVWRNEEIFGDTYVASTMTVDAFVAEVKAADPDPEASRQVHIERIRARNAARRGE
jgi:hypothetical protein